MRLTRMSLLLIAAVLFWGCSHEESKQEKLYKRLVETESEYWNKNSTAQNLLNRIESKKTQILWSTNFHTAAPVPVGAVGPEEYTGKLKGILQNDSIGRVLKAAVRDHVNVILVIGDGMGNMHMALPVYMRYAEKSKEATMFEKIMKEGSCGYSYTGTSEGLVTGSAASGTAIACGKKTRMNMVGVDRDGNPMESALAVAKRENYKTALVTDAPVTDATPAVFYAHSADRDAEDGIAHQLYTGNMVDVILGGGANHFLPQGSRLADFYPEEKTNNFESVREDSLNLIRLFRERGYNLAFNLKELKAAPGNGPLLGLFGQGGMPAVIDHPKEGDTVPYVEDMARKALEIIAAGGGPYFTMIECGRIDWEAHDNDVDAVYQAVEDMNRVLQVAYSFYEKDPRHTLLVFTSDHETGGLEIAYRKMPKEEEETAKLSDGEVWKNITNPLGYDDYVKILKRQNKTVSSVLSGSGSVAELKENVKKYLGIALSDEDAELIFYSKHGYKRYKEKE